MGVSNVVLLRPVLRHRDGHTLQLHVRSQFFLDDHGNVRPALTYPRMCIAHARSARTSNG
jgi:hypothetical protein